MPKGRSATRVLSPECPKWARALSARLLVVEEEKAKGTPSLQVKSTRKYIASSRTLFAVRKFKRRETFLSIFQVYY